MVGVEFGGTDSSSRFTAEKGVAMVSDRPCCGQTRSFQTAVFLRPCSTELDHHYQSQPLPASAAAARPASPPPCLKTFRKLPHPQKLQKAAFNHKMLLMPSGARESIRFLPALNISAGEIDAALERFEACCKEVFG
jgi:hypothetical protein